MADTEMINPKMIEMLEEWVQETRAEVKELNRQMTEVKASSMRIENKVTLLEQRMTACAEGKNQCHDRLSDHESRMRDVEQAVKPLTKQEVDDAIAAHPTIQVLNNKIHVGVGITMVIAVIAPLLLKAFFKV